MIHIDPDACIMNVKNKFIHWHICVPKFEYNTYMEDLKGMEGNLIEFWNY